MQHNLKYSIKLKTAGVVYHLEFWGKGLAHEQSNRESQLQMFSQEHPHLKVGFLNQVHQSALINADTQQAAEYGDGDAVFTAKPLTACIIRTADCIPLLGYSRDASICFGIHAGWRGLEKEIITQTIDSICQKFNTKASSLNFFIGPFIAQHSYETGPDVYKHFKQGFYEQKNEKAYLNLGAIALSQLQSAGVQPTAIRWLNENTMGSHDFYSHRSGETGRNVSVIWFEPQ